MRRLAALILMPLLSLAGCLQPTTRPAATTAPAARPSSDERVLLDFESPDVPVAWVPLADASMPSTAPASVPATTPAAQGEAPNPQRSSLKPQAGLWCLTVPVAAPGELRYAPAKPLDIGGGGTWGGDLLTVEVAHEDAPARNGACLAAVRISDADGHSFEGDAYPVLSTWQAVPLDLRQALEHEVDVSRITAIALVLHRIESGPPITVKTDTWAVQKNARQYIGSSAGAPKTFFVESRGSRIHVGSVGQYEMVISDEGGVRASVPWLQVYAGSQQKQVLGQPATGLFLLDQNALTQGPARNTTPDDQAGRSNEHSWYASDFSWPAALSPTLSTLHWQVAWTSPVAAIIEGRQEAGGFDRMGEPVLTANWRLMIYQWGQVFVDVRWMQTGEAPPSPPTRPVSWALISSEMPRTGEAPAERLLTEVYPATFREGLQTALPHQMQTHSGVAMIAPASRQKDNFWWARDQMPQTRWIFGTGIPTPPAVPGTGNPVNGEATCMLLVNVPTALSMAGAFGQYLVPGKIIVNQGELDRNFPGDANNDGFVETYGFQVVRLANGRATFTIYPQERPIFYPPILFTIPAAEREALDLTHSKLLINIDGKQFANPPQFPDGSFLLQVPYTLDRPVNVEAVLVK